MRLVCLANKAANIISEFEMTMRVIDVAPNEAPLAMLADRIEKASWHENIAVDELLGRDLPLSEEEHSILREFIGKAA